MPEAVRKDDITSLSYSNPINAFEQSPSFPDQNYPSPQFYDYGSFDQYNPSENIPPVSSYNTFENADPEMGYADVFGDPSFSSDMYYPQEEAPSYFQEELEPSQPSSFINYLLPTNDTSISAAIGVLAVACGN